MTIITSTIYWNVFSTIKHQNNGDESISKGYANPGISSLLLDNRLSGHSYASLPESASIDTPQQEGSSMGAEISQKLEKIDQRQIKTSGMPVAENVAASRER